MKRDASEPHGFEPFADDAAVETIGALTIENGSDCIAVHGSLDLTRDRRGLARARRLRSALDTIVSALEAQADLPADRQEVAQEAAQEAVRENDEGTRPVKDVPNPFA